MPNEAARYLKSIRQVKSERRPDGTTVVTYEAEYQPNADAQVAERVAIGIAIETELSKNAPRT